MFIGDFIGREKELMQITASWISGDCSLPMSLLLIGEPKMGKNRLIYQLAQKTDREFYIFQGHEDITVEPAPKTTFHRQVAKGRNLNN